MDELESVVDDDVAQVDVYLLPPDPGPGGETDADSGDEDCNDPNRLSRRQLQAPAELVVHSSQSNEVVVEQNIVEPSAGNQRQSKIEISDKLTLHLSTSDEVAGPSTSTAGEQPSTVHIPRSSKQKRKRSAPRKGPPVKQKQTENSSLPKKRVTKRKPKKPTRIWEKGDIDSTNINQAEWVRPPHLTVTSLSQDSHPIEFFNLFINNEVLEMLVRHSVLFAAADKNNPNFQLSHDQMSTFIGILLLSGYVPLPRRRMFWEEKDDTFNLMVSKSMRRNTFEEIFRYLHVVDNDQIDKSDRLAKIRPLLDKLNDLFMIYAPIEKDLSIDESMIPYFGRHGCKQFIRNKPVRFGYKAWVLATKLGYCIHTDIYMGKNDTFDPKLGLGGSVVMNLTSKLRESYPETPFSVYFDNFFNCPTLLAKLKESNFLATGTVKVDRTDQCPLDDKVVMKKQARGSFDSRINKKDNICAVRWHDNSVVTLLSTEYGVQPVRAAQRYSRTEHKRVDVVQPNLIHFYNKFMGGVDQMDANVACYRIGMRGKKWYIPILFWLLDVAFNNAYQLARSYKCNVVDLLHFRRQVATCLLLKYGEDKTSPGPARRYITPRIIPDVVRLENNDHIILTQQSRRRCAVCSNKTTKSCKKCGVALHDKCFLQFHS